MIGAFARMFGSRDRILSVEETDAGIQVTARNREGVDHVAQAADAPPEAFVQKLSHEGGDVYVVPLLEALRTWLKKGRTVSHVSDNTEYSEKERNEG